MAFRRHLHVLMLMEAFDLIACDSEMCNDRRRRSSAMKTKFVIYVSFMSMHKFMYKNGNNKYTNFSSDLMLI